jgi:kynurenine formamidase
LRLLDLSQPFDSRTPRSSDHPAVKFKTIRHFAANGIVAREVSASLHSGTHVDAPSMVLPAGPNIDGLPLESFCGTGLVLDLSKLGEWGVISADVLERVGKDLRPGDIAAFWCDWAKYYLTDEEKYVLKSPGLDKSGADWLVDRKVKAVFSDTPSSEHIFMRSRQWKQLRPDIFDKARFDVADFPPLYVHRRALGAGIMLVEHLSGALGALAGQRAMLMALPVKYAGVEAAPTRAVAVLEWP